MYLLVDPHIIHPCTSHVVKYIAITCNVHIFEGLIIIKTMDLELELGIAILVIH